MITLIHIYLITICIFFICHLSIYLSIDPSIIVYTFTFPSIIYIPFPVYLHIYIFFFFWSFYASIFLPPSIYLSFCLVISVHQCSSVSLRIGPLIRRSLRLCKWKTLLCTSECEIRDISLSVAVCCYGDSEVGNIKAHLRGCGAEAPLNKCPLYLQTSNTNTHTPKLDYTLLKYKHNRFKH